MATRLSKKQKVIVDTFLKHFTNVSKTCKACRISRSSFYDMKSKFPHFAEAIDDAKLSVDDMIETSLIAKALADKDSQILIHLSKTRLKNRGYGDKVESVERKEIVVHSAELSKEELKNFKSVFDDEF